MPQEILIPEEITTSELDQKIEQALVRQNVTDKVIAELKEKYGHLRLRDIEDKETYLEIKSARREVSKVRIIAEKICKMGREESLRIQRLWLSKEKQVVGKIAEVEDVLKAEEDRFDAEVERKERLAQQQREEQFAERQRTLLKYGAQFIGGCYILNHISYETDLIKNSDEDVFREMILPKYFAEFSRVESQRKVEEQRRLDEMEKIRQEKQALEEQQQTIREQRMALEKQQDQFNREKELAEQRQKDQREAAEKQRIWDEGAVERERQMKEAAELKAQQELAAAQMKKQEELEKAKDKEKFQDIISQYKAITFYEMKSPLYRKKLQMIKEKHDEILNL